MHGTFPHDEPERRMRRQERRLNLGCISAIVCGIACWVAILWFGIQYFQ